MNHKDNLYRVAVVHFQKGELEDARHVVRKVLKEYPGHVEAYHLMGVIEIQQGNAELAADYIRKAISIGPSQAVFHYSLGRALQEGRRLEESLAAYDRAINLDPNLADTDNRRAQVLKDLGQKDKALAACERALQLAPNSVGGHINHGNILREVGLKREALRAFDHALQLAPDNAGLHTNRGNVLRDMGLPKEALTAYDRALGLDPGLVVAHNNRGNVLIDLGYLHEALQAFDQALRLEPGYAGAYYNRGNVLRDLCYFDKAERDYRQSIELNPDDASVHSSLIYLLAACARLSPDKMLEEQRRWDRVHGREGLAYRFPVRDIDMKPGWRIKVGYLSPDFRRHVVSYFIKPILASHNSERFEIYCYDTNSRGPDSTTEHLQAHVENWRTVVGKSDRELAEMIHEDKIDILVDLAGHTQGGRLKVLTFKPAPVQVGYLGFFAASGLETMDYWLTDEILHPIDTVEKTVEKIYRLPRCSFCYQPPVDMPSVSPCPNDTNQVVFGSFNNLSKLTPEVIEVWSRILLELPGSRLLLMGNPLIESATRELYMSRFAQYGIQPDQLLLRKGSPFVEYLETYAEVDIVLDPFPRTGGTTTIEALWMGLPVVTLAGKRYVERISASKLAAVGLEDLITISRDGYIKKALSLANDVKYRISLRTNLRGRIMRSELCDGPGLARAIETAYERMALRIDS